MKKAKIMLSAIAVIAVISGTLAFKAHYKGTPHTYYICPTAGPAETFCVTTTATATADLQLVQPVGWSQITNYGTLQDPQGAACTTGANPAGPCISPIYATALGQ